MIDNDHRRSRWEEDGGFILALFLYTGIISLYRHYSLPPCEVPLRSEETAKQTLRTPEQFNRKQPIGTKAYPLSPLALSLAAAAEDQAARQTHKALGPVSRSGVQVGTGKGDRPSLVSPRWFTPFAAR